MEYDARFMGRMIKYAREAKNLTQDDAAIKLNISESFYKQIEQGTGNPSLPTFYSILNFYNLSADSLLFPGVSEPNSTANQIIRILGRCNDSELRFIFAMITALISNNDNSLKDVATPTLEELYAKCLAEFTYKDSESTK